jgi:hypothetical protein
MKHQGILWSTLLNLEIWEYVNLEIEAAMLIGRIYTVQGSDANTVEE